jgi:hypothetical protein
LASTTVMKFEVPTFWIASERWGKTRAFPSEKELT